MAHAPRLRLIQHGAIVLLVGLLCGLPTVGEALGGEARVWHTAHEALIMMGVWMLAASSAFPALEFEAREARAFVLSLLVMGYSFALALIVGGIIGETPFAPGHTPASLVAFLASVVGIFGAIISAALTVMGASAALRAGGTDDPGAR